MATLSQGSLAVLFCTPLQTDGRETVEQEVNSKDSFVASPNVETGEHQMQSVLSVQLKCGTPCTGLFDANASCVTSRKCLCCRLLEGRKIS